jgi:hypothetical protein
MLTGKAENSISAVGKNFPLTRSHRNQKVIEYATLRFYNHIVYICETKREMSHSTCAQCGEIMTVHNRVNKSVSKRGKQYYMSRCRTCIDESETILRRLKKDNPQPPAGTPCACCKRIDKLFCDHDHSTKEFRSWICRNCNSGIGLLGDSEEGLRQALAYLERARPKSRSRSPSVNKTNDTVQNGTD